MASRWARVGSGELGIVRVWEEACKEDGLGGVMDRESRQCGFARWNGRARSMMPRSCPQSLLTHDILSPFLGTKLMP